MTMPSKKTLMILVPSILVVLGIIAATGFWMTNPQRTVDKFFKTVESGDSTAAMAFVSDDTTQKKRENIQWFVDDWTEGETFSWDKTKDESWRSRADGADTKGATKFVTLPTTKYLAHNYQAFVDVTFDEFEDPVIVVLQRNTKNTNSFFSQIFRGWKIVQIKYQPLDESDFEDFGAEFDDSEEDPFGDDVADHANTNTNTSTNANSSSDETKPADETNSNTNTSGGLVEPEDSDSAAE